MPISQDRKHLYPKNWKELSEFTRRCANYKCEICKAKNHEPHPDTKSKVILTVHHMDFNPQNNEWWNLIAVCQRCHLALDKKFKLWRRGKKLKLSTIFRNAKVDQSNQSCIGINCK